MSGKQKTPRIDKDEQELDRKDRALSSPAIYTPAYCAESMILLLHSLRKNVFMF